MTSILKNILPSTRKGYQLLMKNDPLILSASTAFFMTFSISPILIILTDLLKPLLGEEIVHAELFGKVKNTLGHSTAKDVHSIVDGFEAQESSLLLTVLSTIFFYFIATTLLAVIKQSIHQIWSIRKKDNTKTEYYVKERLTGIAMMFLAALLAIVSYTMDMLEANVQDQDIVARVIGIGFSLIIVVIWFTMLIKYLPEARVQWKVAIAGGLFTGILFNSGVFLLGKILVHRKIAMIFGVSSSMAMILLFIFYCSFILYLGVSFTFEIAKVIRRPIVPGKYSDRFTEEIRKRV